MFEILAVTLGVFLGSMVSGFAGFAFSAACGAVLFQFSDPHRAIPLMMACSIAAQLLTMIRLRRSVQFEASPWLFAGGIAGVAVAVMLISAIDAHALRWFFGAFLTCYALYLLFKSPLALLSVPGAVGHTVVGALGGAVGALTAMPGAIPTAWCEMRGCNKEQQRALVQPFIIVMQVIALFLFAVATPTGIPRDVPYYLAISLPALCLGSWLGAAAFQRVNDVIFRKIILLMLVASGLMLLT